VICSVSRTSIPEDRLLNFRRVGEHDEMRKLLLAGAIALCGLAMATSAQCETLKDMARDGRLTVPRIVVILDE
jgi:hypothetical protein